MGVVLVLRRSTDAFVRAILERLLVLLAGLTRTNPTRLLAARVAAVPLATKVATADDERAPTLGPPALHQDEVQSQRTAELRRDPSASAERQPMSSEEPSRLHCRAPCSSLPDRGPGVSPPGPRRSLHRGPSASPCPPHDVSAAESLGAGVWAQSTEHLIRRSSQHLLPNSGGSISVSRTGSILLSPWAAREGAGCSYAPP